jgi:predicted cupin superfamily sugar epimerase
VPSIDPEDIVETFGMVPLPIEGGLIKEDFRGEQISTIYYLLRFPETSGLHRLDHTEVFHYYDGDPAKMLLLFPDGTVQEPILGTDLRNGQRPQAVVPPGVWQATETLGAWTFMGTNVAPPWSESITEYGHAKDLAPLYPAVKARIYRLGR